MKFDGKLAAGAASPHHRRWLLFTAAMVILLWVSYFAGVSAMVDMGTPEPTEDLYLPRTIVTLAGVLVTFAIVALQLHLRNPSLARRGIIAVVAAVAAAALQSAINIEIFRIFFPGTSPSWGVVTFVTDYAWRIWIWVAGSGTILAMSYASDIRERERRILALQNLAHSAQLQALRFQLNPHFLFNALNSIAGLISTRRVDAAETMTENLADFLRLTLTLDPQKLITLEEELHLQSLYLEVEKERFPDRLAVRIDVASPLRSALVPSLITQPLVENSVKYAVAQSECPVELSITARKLDDRLELIVSDSGGDGAIRRSKGACLGLRNVADRIRMHYGDGGTLISEPLASGGFRNQLLIPMEMRT